MLTRSKTSAEANGQFITILHVLRSGLSSDNQTYSKIHKTHYFVGKNSGSAPLPALKLYWFFLGSGPTHFIEIPDVVLE